MIADTLELSSQQVEVAIRYIEEHHDEVTEGSNRILARHARGNPPELQSKLDAIRGSARAKLEELRRLRCDKQRRDGEERDRDDNREDETRLTK